MSDGAARKAGSKSTFHFAAGLGSGVLSAVLLQPIDLLKTRVQQSGHHSLLRSLDEIRSRPTPGTTATSSSSSPNSLLALWRGTVPSALRTGFGSAIYFSTLNAIRQHVSASSPLSTKPSSTSASAHAQQQHSSSLVRLGGAANMLSGAAARAFAGLILMPLTVIKVRYESSLYSYTSLAGAARDILRAEGPRGFFAGFGATAIRDAPYAGFYVLFYEQSKRTLSSLYPTTSSTSTSASAASTSPSPDAGAGMGTSRAAAINFSSGVLSAAVCSVISNPFDAVKTRIQLQPAAYRNMAVAAARMLREEGFRSLWSGLGLRMGRKAVSSALAWTLYEELIRRAEVKFDGGGGRGKVRGDVL